MMFSVSDFEIIMYDIANRIDENVPEMAVTNPCSLLDKGKGLLTMVKVRLGFPVIICK